MCWGTMSATLPMLDATAQLGAKGNVPALLPPRSLRGEANALNRKERVFLEGEQTYQWHV